MNEEILISIVVPVYNVEDYLRKCIESILNQTHKNLQIILIDDGSTDNSGAICDEYAVKDSRIEVIHKPNGGVTSARKAGLDLVRGNYVGFVDSDDWIDSNMYEEMLNNLIKTGADFVHTGIIDEKNGIEKYICDFEEQIVYTPKDDKELWKSYMNLNKDFAINSYLYTKLFKKNIIVPSFKDVADDICFGEDRIAITECLLKSRSVSFLKKAYYHYVRREGSATFIHGSTGIIWTAKMYEEMIKRFKKYNEYENVKQILESALTIRILDEIINNPLYQNKIITYTPKNLSELYGKRIIIYGAGKVGYQYYRQLCAYSKIQVVDWVDKDFAAYNYEEREVNPLSNINNLEYDLILIAVKSKSLSEQIMNDLSEMGVDKNKMRWYEPTRLTQ